MFTAEDLCDPQRGLLMRTLVHPQGGCEAAVKMNEAGLCELVWEDLQDIWQAEEKQAAEHYVRCVYKTPKTNPNDINV